MLMKIEYCQARELLLQKTAAVSTEWVPLSKCAWRILARDLEAKVNVPPFDRSAYDGYALIAGDTTMAEENCPVSLKILEEVPAGELPSKRVVPGTAVKILTGAPIPLGADAVIPFEKTTFTEEVITVYGPVKRGANIVREGDDVCAGKLLAYQGTQIDTGMIGTLSSQGIPDVEVYRAPKIGILSTGNEVVEVVESLPPGKIRNSNRHMLEAAIQKLGLKTEYLGLAGDSVQEISALMKRGLELCDAVISTGGVSVGDYDLTPSAMENIGADIMIRGVSMKPGMASAFGEKGGKLIYGLSGNPASSLTSFYAVVLPSLRKLAGFKNCVSPDILVTLANDFSKKSPSTRLLRGKLDLSTGSARIQVPSGQGNVVLSSAIGCDVMAVIPAGSGPLPAGTVLKGFMI